MKRFGKYVTAFFAFVLILPMGLMQTFAQEAQVSDVLVTETIYEEESVVEITPDTEVSLAETGEETGEGFEENIEDNIEENSQEETAETDPAVYENIVTEEFADAFSEFLGDGFDARSFIKLARDLSYGSIGDDVRQIQERLIELGYDTGDVDGVFGNITRNAVMAFQRDRGLVVDGIIGHYSITSMNEDDGNDDPGSPTGNAQVTTVLPTLSRSLLYGSSGSDVLAMQKALLELGYNVGPADGEYGSMTEAAVYEFQRKQGLIVDGWVGEQTWDILRKLTQRVSNIASQTAQTSSNQTADPAAVSAVSLSISRDLSYGSNGNDVKELQQALQSLGFDVGGIDGAFGSLTNNAVLAFQRKYNLVEDGIVGSYTIASMKKALSTLAPAASTAANGTTANAQDPDSDIDPALANSIIKHELSVGTRGEEVKTIQQELIRLGYLPQGYDDGIYGNVTKGAVSAFQNSNGAVTPNGNVDIWTIHKLDGYPIAKSEVLFNKVLSTSSGDYNFTRNVSYEMEGDDIELIQERMAGLGYLAATPAGYYGNMTYDAILAFQRDAGLAQTGSIDLNTLVKLFSSSAPRHGDPSDTYTASALADSIAITDKNYDRGNYQIKYIIPHHMAGRMSGENCANYFVHNGLENSANYCIGYNGDIALGVPEDYGAWTSDFWAADEQGITIEVSDTSISDWTIPKKAQDSLVDLCVDLIKRNPTIGNKMIYDESDRDIVIKARKTRDPSLLSQVKGNVLLHNWTSGGIKDCPGEGMLKVLPDIVKRVNERLRTR